MQAVDSHVVEFLRKNHILYLYYLSLVKACRFILCILFCSVKVLQSYPKFKVFKVLHFIKDVSRFLRSLCIVDANSHNLYLHQDSKLNDHIYSIDPNSNKLKLILYIYKVDYWNIRQGCVLHFCSS